MKKVCETALHVAAFRSTLSPPTRTHNIMSKHIDLLNQVQSFLITQANAKGINLADSFDSVEDFKQFVIGVAFKGLQDAGMDVETSFDAVTGDGQYEALFQSVTA